MAEERVSVEEEGVRGERRVRRAERDVFSPQEGGKSITLNKDGSRVSDAERVRVAVRDHVATVTLARPEKHNALDLPMFEGIVAATERVAAEPGVRVVVLHGEGPSFCSGLDLGSVMSAAPDPADIASSGNGLDASLDALAGPVPNRFQRVAYDWVTLPVPVIAAVHGNCLGGGLQIALGADVRIATPDARMSVMEVKWGLIPDMSLTQTLPRLVGIDVAKELVYTARVLSGEEALALGVVTRVAADPLAAAQELAREIAGRSPDAIRGAKRLIDGAWGRPPEVGLRLEAEIQRALIGSPNQLAAVVAGVSKQAPEFADPPAGDIYDPHAAEPDDPPGAELSDPPAPGPARTLGS